MEDIARAIIAGELSTRDELDRLPKQQAAALAAMLRMMTGDPDVIEPLKKAGY